MSRDHIALKHLPHSDAVHAHVVRDGVKMPGTLPNKCPNQILGYTAEAKSPEHNRGFVVYVGNCFVSRFEDLVHCTLRPTAGAIESPPARHKGGDSSPHTFLARADMPSADRRLRCDD
jgi:hypothetical protein